MMDLGENFVKLKENLAKHKNDTFMKFSQKHESENFRSHPSANQGKHARGNR